MDVPNGDAGHWTTPPTRLKPSSRMTISRAESTPQILNKLDFAKAKAEASRVDALLTRRNFLATMLILLK